jgi:energy-coupling factor transporter ATP-binding protein EcfA2
MPGDKIGPIAESQLHRLARSWRQGEHVLITGETGSGKTALARHLDQIRVDAGSHCIVFVCKLLPDETLTKDYKGWTRWTKFKKRVSPHDNKILLWPNLEGMSNRDAVPIQREIFREAVDAITKTGLWTIHIDEGLYFCKPSFINMEHDLEHMYFMGRSAGITMITLAQRPAHLPLVLYGSASHAFTGHTTVNSDMKRLSELGGPSHARDRAQAIVRQGEHDFLWTPKKPYWPDEPFNLRR